MRHLSRFILITLMGWKIKGSFPKILKKYVIIVAPHTHWADFFMGLLVRSATGLRANYVGKASLFKPPFGFIFKALGGAPIDRSKSSNKVESIVSIYNSKEEFKLSLSPEGTRKKVMEWKTGFYFIAKGAQVPIVRVIFDFEHKVVSVLEPFYTSDNKDADLSELRSVYEGVKGKIAEYS